jgi:hypothetical protein
MSTSAQLIAAGVLFAGFVAVWLIGRRRPAGNPRLHRIGTGALVRRGDGTAVFACDLCSLFSPASNNQALLWDWARQHADQYHRDHAHLAR